MLFGKNSKIVEETKTICVPIKAQLSDYHTKTGGMKHIPRGKWVRMSWAAQHTSLKARLGVRLSGLQFLLVE